MRLLNVHTFQFREFYNYDIPEKYAVTSHRWSAGNECMIDDVRNGLNRDKSGYHKVQGFAKFVRDNFPAVDWLWIDTCCVNQDSDREVSEAVNSMFRWYSQAEVCLAYLADVQDPNDMTQFRQSVWFRRGWTLQELLAPHTVIFLSQNWIVIGRKGNSISQTGLQFSNILLLEPEIANITGIPEAVLYDYSVSKQYSVNTRLAWMDGRQTTREEDIVYALFGIFDIILPVLYGERATKAKRRLLKEIDERLSSILSDGEEIRTTQQSLPPSTDPAPSSITPNRPASSAECVLRAKSVKTSLISSDDANYSERDSEAWLECDIADVAFAKTNKALHATDYPKAYSCLQDLLQQVTKLPQRQRIRYHEIGIKSQLAECAFHMANRAFEKADHEKAKLNYQSVLQHLQSLPVELKHKYELYIIEYRLAICTFHTRKGDPLHAESLLIRVVNNSADQHGRELNLWHARHLLSQVYIETNELEKALKICKNAYSGRRRNAGKDDPSCYESLALLARIYQLKGDHHKSNKCRRLLPNELEDLVCWPFLALGPCEKRWKESKILQTTTPTIFLSFSSDNRFIARYSSDEGIVMWNLHTGIEVFKFNIEAEERRVWKPTLSPDCSQLAMRNISLVQLWDLRSRKKIRSYYLSGDLQSHDSTSTFGTVSFAPDGSLRTRIITTTLDLGEPAYRDRWSSKYKLQKILPDGVQSTLIELEDFARVFHSPDGEVIAVVNSEGTIDLLHVDRKDIPGVKIFHLPSDVTSHRIVFSANSDLLAIFTRGCENTIYITNRNGHLKRAIHCSTFLGINGSSQIISEFSGSAFSPGGQLVVARFTLLRRHGNQLICIWNVANGSLMAHFNETSERLHFGYDIAFSPDGHVLTVGTDPGKVKLYEVSSLLSKKCTDSNCALAHN